MYLTIFVGKDLCRLYLLSNPCHLAKIDNKNKIKIEINSYTKTVNKQAETEL